MEGTEAGGHLGTQQSIKDILPDIVKAVNIPVIAAGGATDGAAVAELLKLGASGVQMGSRFAASEESNGAPALKELYLKMTKEDVVQIDSPVGYKGRAILNPLPNRFWKVRSRVPAPVITALNNAPAASASSARSPELSRAMLKPALFLQVPICGRSKKFYP